MYLGRSPCCLMSSPLVPPSGYFQLCTQDNDVFWAHPCSQGDNACDFNDYVAFPLGSTSSSKCFLLNLPPTQIVGCNEHCCAWDLLAESFASSFVLFASSFCYSMTTRPHAVCEESVVADGKPMCPCSCHPLPSRSWFDSHSATVSAYRQFRNVADLSVSKLFNPVSWAQLFFFFLSIILKSLIDWNDTFFLEKIPTTLTFVSLQTVNLSPTAEMRMDSPSAFYDTTSAESTPLNTKNPSFEVQLPEDSKQRVNKGFRVSEILGTTNNYRNSILEFFTNFAK